MHKFIFKSKYASPEIFYKCELEIFSGNPKGRTQQNSQAFSSFTPTKLHRSAGGTVLGRVVKHVHFPATGLESCWNISEIKKIPSHPKMCSGLYAFM